MFLWFLLFQLASAITVSPVNISCITGTTYSLVEMNQSILGRGYYKPTITLLPFSYVEIWFDFREISLSESLFPVELMIGDSVERLSNYTGIASKFSLYVTQQYNLTITINLNDDYEMFKFLLINTTTINVSEAQPRFQDRHSSFMWVVKQEDNINLPFNFPNFKSFEGFFFNRITDNLETSLSMQIPVKGVNYYAENIEYWNTYSTFTVPYIPYISNCEGVGGNIFLTKELEDPTHCDIVPINETQPINQFVFGSSAKGDSCSHQITCIYDESIKSRHEYPYWQTLQADGTLMYITHSQISYQDYAMNKPIDQQDLIACIISESDGDNTTDKFPTEITLTLGYYQVSQTEKRMISCEVSFELFTTATDNFTYTVKIVQKPLNHTAILIAFGFSFYVYMIAFMIIGAASTIENLILGMYHWVANKESRRFIKFKVYLPLLYEVLKGSFLAAVPMMVMGGLISIIMGGHLFNLDMNHFRSSNPSDPVVIWDLMTSVEISDYSSTLATNNRSGRLGIAFMTVGTYIILYTTKYFIGMERKKQKYQEQDMYGQRIDPQLWAKFKFLFGTVVYFVLQLLLMYFAFSKFYADNIWVFIVLTKVMSMVLEEVVDIIFENIISSLPLKIILNITSYLNTLAADDFYEFMFSFLVDVALEMCEKAYLATIQNITANYLDVKLKQLSLYIDKFLYDGEKEESADGSDLMSEDSEDHEIVVATGANDISFEEEMDYRIRSLSSQDDYQYDEMEKVYKQLLIEAKETKFKEIAEIVEWKDDEDDDDEEEEKRNDMLQMVVDVFSVPTNIILQPFAVVILWMTYNETNTLNSFGMSWQITPTYIFSNFTLGPFTIMNVILTLFLLQNFHHFEMEQWTTDNMERYKNRTHYWKSDDDEVPTNCEVKVRSVIKSTLSSQIFFVVILYVIAMQFVQIGISAMVSNSYDPFSDFGSLLVINSWLLTTHFITRLVILIATKVFNIWDYKKFHSSSVSVERNVGSEESDYNLVGPYRQSSSEQSDICRTGLNLNEMVVKDDESEGDKEREKVSEQQSDREIIKRLDQRERGLRLAKAKIASICAKFKPIFEDQSKKMEYSLKNKEYFVENIERIFDEVALQELPDDVRNCETNIKPLKKLATMKINLNEVPRGQSLIKRWLEEAKQAKQKAQAQALEVEKSIKKCLYCFNNWGIYFGFNGGMCLQCSEEMEKLKQD